MNTKPHEAELLTIGEHLGAIKTGAILQGDRLHYTELTERKLADLKQFAMDAKTHADLIVREVVAIEEARKEEGK